MVDIEVGGFGPETGAAGGPQQRPRTDPPAEKWYKHRMPVRTPDVERYAQLMRQAIGAFELDLSGLTVLTEAASGPFVVTPLIAAMAGAERVRALTRDSRFASAGDVMALTSELAERCGVEDRIEVLTSRNDPGIAQSDVVTNLGFVRPLHRPMLERLGPTSAIALMVETWEHRAADIDLASCRELGIPVLGTNEDDPRLRTFRYLPEIAAKLLAEIDVAVRGSRLILVSDDKFAAAIRAGLDDMGAAVELFAPPLSPGLTAFEKAVAEADAIVVAHYPGTEPILGGDAGYSAADLLQYNQSLGLAHISGSVDPEDVAAAGLRHAPEHIAPAGTMSVTAGYLGPEPVVDLVTAGLKVGEALARARQQGLNSAEAEAAVLDHLAVAQGFPEHAGGTA